MKLFKKLSFLGLALVAGLTVVGCENNDEPKPNPDPTPEPEPEPDPDPTPEPKPVEPAKGAYSYVASSYEERTEILGVLEKYAVDNQLTGITIYEDGGYVMYADNIVKGTNSYIPGYGFGIIEEGNISKPLAGETNTKYQYYYHDYEASNPQTINYMNDKGSVVGGIVSYISGSFWSVRMNETKDGYEWYPMLAVTKPIAVNADSTGQATKYKFELRTGDNGGLKYSTLSTNPTLSKYNGRDVEAEDYLNGFKVLMNQSNGFARGAEQLDGAGSIKGTAQYYNNTKNGYNESAWNNVAIKVYEEGGKPYMEVEFNLPCSQFYAMYYLGSSLYAPIPSDFMTDLETASKKTFAQAYGNFTDNGLTPVDTFLSTGPYVIEAWNDQEIVFKKSAYYEEEGRFKVQGIHYAILPSATTDAEAAFKEFLANKLSGCGIPSTKLNEYKSDPRTTTTVGSTTTKLNVNTCTPEEWEYLFGENGVVTQTSKDDYWQVEPAMANADFVKGLSYAIDRQSYAETRGVTPSINYFGSSYQSDPENGVIYNSTEAHKNAIADLVSGTDGYGYSEELAIQSFKAAAQTLIANGSYKAGDTITLDIVWQSQTNVDQTGKHIEDFWMKAWDAADTGLTLKINNIVPNDWQDAYYEYMMVGQFDLGFGGIEGNTLNPLNFLEVLKSDNSSGFTLNWGPNTNEVSSEIVYDGVCWSFDALWQAADTGGYFENGVYTPSYEVALNSVTLNNDGTATVVCDLDMLEGIENVEVSFEKAVIFGYADAAGSNYMEEEVPTVELSADKKTVTVTVSKELVDKYNACQYPLGYDQNGNVTCVGMDIYFEVSIFGISSTPLVTLFVGLK